MAEPGASIASKSAVKCLVRRLADAQPYMHTMAAVDKFALNRPAFAVKIRKALTDYVTAHSPNLAAHQVCRSLLRTMEY